MDPGGIQYHTIEYSIEVLNLLNEVNFLLFFDCFYLEIKEANKL